MSVGGRVVEVIPMIDKVWINTKENPNYTNTVAIYIELTKDALSINPGDKVWWQGGFAFWTKEDESIIERRLKRLGYSGVGRPRAEEFILENVR